MLTNRLPLKLVASGTIIALWVWLYARLLSFFTVVFGRSDFRLNQILLILLVGLMVWQIRSGRFSLKLSALPKLHLPALLMAMAGSIGYLLCERFIGMNTISASLFILASYGLLGLWLDVKTWKWGLPAAFLIVSALPFGMFIETFVGYPMRLATAELVQHTFQMVGIKSVNTTTVLVTENGISNIDLPCSGVQSLWTGGMFLLAATWIEQRKINLAWVGIALIFGVLLFITNFVRVLLLTLTSVVLAWWNIAEILHVPLGVVGFVLACGGALLLLRRQPRMAKRSAVATLPSAPIWFVPALTGVIALMAIVHEPFARPTAAFNPIVWNFPSELNVESDPMAQFQIDFLMQDGAEAADRFRFEWKGQTGWIIFVPATTWRAHHLPERCYTIGGFEPSLVEGRWVDETFPFRAVTFEKSDQVGAFWFQSAERTTDDYTARIWDDFRVTRQRWVMVSILFDDPVDHDDTSIKLFYNALHDVVGQTLLD